MNGEPVHARSGRKRILIVDDDPAILEAMQMMLEMEGYDVLTSENGENIDTLTKEAPHIIFLDIWMSGVDGRDICKTIKSEKSTQRIPVVIISASRDVVQSAFDSGADDFLAKPFQMDELLAVISKFLHAN